MIKVRDDVVVREEDITLRFSRSSGPGGQNVNKTDSKVTASVNIRSCPGIANEQKQRLLSRLANRLTTEGILQVASQKHRTQLANRKAVIERLTELLQNALKDKPLRKPTSVPRAARRKRIERKRKRSQLKQLRQRISSTDG